MSRLQAKAHPYHNYAQSNKHQIPGISSMVPYVCVCECVRACARAREREREREMVKTF